MIKENLKIAYSIKVDNLLQRTEASCLLDSLNIGTYQIQVGHIFKLSVDGYTEITLPELRELARPKEYLNDKFELVVTNMPQDGWRLIPDGANNAVLVKGKHIVYFKDYTTTLCTATKAKDREWYVGSLSFSEYQRNYPEHKYWQRNPKENEMTTEKKARFLHQEWYEAFGRGEQIEYEWQENGFIALSGTTSLSAFDDRDVKFRLKPRTIQIGTHTIVKPIDVKPEIGTKVFYPVLNNRQKYDSFVWNNASYCHELFDRSLCHLTADDAIAHTDALLALMSAK